MNRITVNTENKKFKTNDLFGIFFEDLNHAADGGLYPEQVRNRSFEFCEIDNPNYTNLTAWSKRGEGEMYVDTKEPLNDKNNHYLVLSTNTGISAVNEGFNSGIALTEGDSYNLSFFGKSCTPATAKIAIEDKDGNEYTSKTFELNSVWTKYKAKLTAPKTDYCARLSITIHSGSACFEMVSLIPDKTYKNHGLRYDLAKMLEELQPKFVRFPGGCLTHDGSLDKNARNSLYRWQNTIGNLEDRPPRRNNWGYNQTAGLGYYEYFVLCEDIGAKAIPVVSGGWNPHAHEGVSIEDLGEFVEETLDLIEFANGDINTKWGQVRCQLGHEKPFNLEYIGIGNEEVAGGFFDRYPYFHNAIREKYPDIKIIGTSGPWSNGYDFTYGWREAKKYGTDLVDEHYYMIPEWFVANVDRYDSYDRLGPKAFAGEYASWGNEYKNALAECCYMTGLENNADVVGLACYAPLFANADYVNWQPDMIWFDNHRAFGTVNYYAQQMFMVNQADYVVDSELETDVKNIKMTLKPIKGRIGFRFARTSGEIYDVRINGKEIGNSYKTENGTWEVSDKIIQTDKDVRNSRIIFDDVYEDFTLTFKAKKYDGIEGISVCFGIEDEDNYYHWDIGGWNNDVSSLNKGGGTCLEPGEHITVEPDKEMDIKISVNNNTVRCSIDGKVYHEFTEREGYIRPIYYTAGVKGSKTVIKAVNYRACDYNTDIVLDKKVTAAQVISMQSDDLSAKNSFDNPENIIPHKSELKISGNGFNYTFPAQSITVLVVE
ncbi:MAG: carbohydrate binding domain-containing protein [Clostridia bacterium]|nr:carbohydrate binding domain-containing protein [Clostridia bacterium]